MDRRKTSPCDGSKMDLEFTYTPDDFQEMLKAKWPESGGKTRTVTWFLMALFILALLTGVHVWWTDYRDLKMNVLAQSGENPPFEAILRKAIYSPATFLVLFLLAWHWFFIRIRSRRGISLWKHNIAAQQPQTVTIDQDGIKISSPLAETRFRWPMIAYWAETANLFVLRLNTKSLLVIPKRAATSEQLEQLRKSICERIVAPAKGFPVVMAKPDGGGRGAAK